MSLDVKASCNWFGKNRKGNGEDSRVTKAIFSELMDFSKSFKIIFVCTLERIRATSQFRGVQESELIVENKKSLKHAPERARHVAAAAATVAAGKCFIS